ASRRILGDVCLKQLDQLTARSEQAPSAAQLRQVRALVEAPWLELPKKVAVPQLPAPRRCRRTCERPCRTRSPVCGTELPCKPAGSARS
ncbi:unnamed protein product, partial [Symbiodinium necroappetens]